VLQLEKEKIQELEESQERDRGFVGETVKRPVELFMRSEKMGGVRKRWEEPVFMVCELGAVGGFSRRGKHPGLRNVLIVTERWTLFERVVYSMGVCCFESGRGDREVGRPTPVGSPGWPGHHRATRGL